MTDKPLVLVTGASGYIAMHCIVQLLEAGYRVRGTLRSLNKEARLRKIFAEQVENADDRLEFVTANLMADDGWTAAAQDCTYVMHIASPITDPDLKGDEAYVRPAVDGTRRVMQAAVDAGVKRVILTSSVAAVQSLATYQEGRPWTEEHWADPEHADPYSKSKTLAERTAWDIAAQYPSLELTTINPVYVVGPVFDKDFSGSLRVITAFLNREFPGAPRMGFSIVDVRDVASAHVKAMTHPDAPGKRFICTSGFLWAKDIARIINDNFAAEGYRAATLHLPDFVIRFVGLFDSTIRATSVWLGMRTEFSNAQLRTTLDWHPIPAEQSVIESARSLIDKGAV
jgi:dihydroflavonol-4-reductase